MSSGYDSEASASTRTSASGWGGEDPEVSLTGVHLRVLGGRPVAVGLSPVRDREGSGGVRGAAIGVSRLFACSCRAGFCRRATPGGASVGVFRRMRDNAGAGSRGRLCAGRVGAAAHEGEVRDPGGVGRRL
jgi:hypothetical protein